MKEFDSPYDFYQLPEEERKKLIGEVFREVEGGRHVYFPIGLAEGEFNYGKQQGLLIVTSIRRYKDVPWFKVGAFSPDDLDCDLDFENNTSIRQDVIDFIKRMPKQNLTYLGALKAIQSHFQAGVMG